MSLIQGVQSTDFKPIALVEDKYRFITDVKVGSRIGNTSITTHRFQPINGAALGPNNTGSNLTWQISNESFMNSNIKLEAKYTFYVVSPAAAPADLTVAGVKGALANNCGVSSFPINRVIQNGVVRLNNSSQFSTNVNDTMDTFLYNQPADFLATLSPASKLDNYNAFNAGILSNVLRTGGDTIDAIDSRGLNTNYNVQYTSIPGGAAPGALSPNDYVQVVITIQECLLMKPFQYHKTEPNPFYNINDLYLNLTFDNITKFLKYNGLPAGYGIDVNSQRLNCSLLIHSYNPMVQIEKPPRVIYNAPMIQNYKVANFNLAANASSSVEFQNYVLNGLPKMFCLYAKNTGETVNTPQSFAVINKVSFSIGNKVNQMQEYSLTDLYEISTSNGYNQRLSVFAGLPSGNVADIQGCGSVFYFRLKDVAMNELEQSNVNGVYNVLVNATFSNPTGAAQTYTPVFSVVYDNIVINDNGAWSEELPLLSPSKLASAEVEYINDNQVMNSVLGGSFWNDIWEGAKKVVSNPITKQVTKFARNNIPGVSNVLGDNTALGSVAKSLGYGKKGGSVMKIGGKKVSKSSLLGMLD